MENISSGKVKTRKEHKCWGCTEAIPIGSTVMRVTCADCGQISSVHYCDRCEKFLATLQSWETEDGFVFGELLQFPEYPTVGGQNGR